MAICGSGSLGGRALAFDYGPLSVKKMFGYAAMFDGGLHLNG